MPHAKGACNDMRRIGKYMLRALDAYSHAERVNVVLGIYKNYPGSLSSLKTIPRVYFTKPNITQVPQSMPRNVSTVYKSRGLASRYLLR
jgi:hypothetical protein